MCGVLLMELASLDDGSRALVRQFLRRISGRIAAMMAEGVRDASIAVESEAATSRMYLAANRTPTLREGKSRIWPREDFFTVPYAMGWERSGIILAGRKQTTKPALAALAGVAVKWTGPIESQAIKRPRAKPKQRW